MRFARGRDLDFDRRGGESSSFKRLSSDNAYFNGLGSFLGMLFDRDRDRDLPIDRPGGASSSPNRRSYLEPLLGLGLARGFDRPLECADSDLSVALERIVLEWVELGLSFALALVLGCVALVLECVESGFPVAFSRRAILACAEREFVASGVWSERGDAHPRTSFEPGSLDSLLGVVRGFTDLDLEAEIVFEVLGVGMVFLVASVALSSFALLPGASFGCFFMMVLSSALIPGASRLFLSLLTAFLSLDPSRVIFIFKRRIL